MILVSLHDAKAETWSLPRCAQNKATAIREFATLCNDNAHTLVADHPADFDLFQIATAAEPFDGKIVPEGAPVHLANGNDVKRKE